MAYLYQEIMKVPGLTGSWQSRNKQLYESMGSPMGPYTGSLSQNNMLLNSIRDNNYYADGLPGGGGGNGTTSKSNEQRIFDQQAGNINPDNRNFSKDVMSENDWFRNFDNWTQNFVMDYMKPEWEKNTYTPAMKKMNNELWQTNQNMGNSGSYRSGMANKNLAEQAQQNIDNEQRMRTEFNDSSVEMRDQIRQQLAQPLYEANMKRWQDSPTKDFDFNTEGGNTSGLPEDIQGLLDQMNGGGTTDTSNFVSDWTFTPDSSYNPGLFNQYTSRVY